MTIFCVSNSASRDQGTEEEVAVGSRLGAKQIYTPVLPGRPRLSTLSERLLFAVRYIADHPAEYMFKPMLVVGTRINLFGKATNGNSYSQSP